MRALVLQRREVDVLNWCGYAPLLLAVRQGHLLVVKALLAAGADVDLVREDWNTRKPLHLAVDLERREVALALLRHGTSIESWDNKGYLPLHHACIGRLRSGAVRVVDLLLR